MKTDNQELVGKHVFEVAGLGKAPFKYIGFKQMTYSPAPGIFQPGTACAYCATGINNVFIIESSDGKRFHVGCDCLMKTGDNGLIKAYKTSPEIRELNRQKAIARDEAVKVEWEQIIKNPENIAILEKCLISNYKGEKEPWLIFAKRVWPWCGAAGRKRYVQAAKRILVENRVAPQ